MKRNRLLFRILFSILAAAGLMALQRAASAREDGAGGLSLSYEKDLLSLEAADIPLKDVLAALADRAQLQVLLGEDVQSGNVTFHLDKVRLEKALAVILADYNYLASFREEQGVSRMTLLKIYPKGTSGGRLIPLQRQAAVGAVGGPAGDAAGAEIMASPIPQGMPAEGLVAPQPPVVIGGSPESLTEDEMALVALEQRYREEKTALFEQHLQTNREIEATDDPEKRQALQMIAAGQTEDMLRLDQKFTNQMESLKRLQAMEQAQGANPAAAEPLSGQEVTQ